MTAPAYDLESLKDDVGITGTQDDAWLARRVAAVWARFETYTQRYLGPVATWEDDFSRTLKTPARVAPPFWRGNTVPFLTVTPVVEILSATSGGQPVDVRQVLFDPKSGRIESMSGVSGLHWELCDMAYNHSVIVYRAGFSAMPPDLYDALVAILRSQYAARAGGLEGVGALAIKSVTIADVGSVTVGGPAGEFETAAVRSGISDPMLGPWTATLDIYSDLASSIGGGPVCRNLSTNPGAGLAAGGSSVHGP